MATINGTSGTDALTGTSGVDTINGLDGDDTLTGGDGADTINGGNGTDTVDYSAEAGTGAVIVNLSGASVTVGGVTVAAGKARDTFGATDTLTSIENVTAGGGNDTIYGSTGINILIGGNGNDTIYGGGGSDALYGDGGNDILYAGSSASGSWLEGGSGDDTYYVTESTLDPGLVYDEIKELSGGGYDTVHILAGYVLEGRLDQVERIILDGSANSGFTVTDAVNRDVTGSSGNNMIRTAGGVDTINAGDGNDTISAGAGGDTINGGNGNDTLFYENTSTAVTIDLLAGTASGGDAAGDTYTSIENVTGGGGNDTLSGTNGDNVIDGGAGADTMTGRQGNDTYVVDNAGDVVTEASGEGTDTIRTGLASYTLAANFENLAGTRALGQSLTGNSVANVISGFSGDDTLTGLTGNDTLNGGHGTDSLYGGANNDTLIGDHGDDLLDGGTGDDAMTGGFGNDVYVIDSYADTVTELANQGTDTVQVDLYDYTIGANVENLDYIGLDYIVVTGNDLANVISLGIVEDTVYAAGGNDTVHGLAGDDVLLGEDGDDLLDGGTGADYMIGGSGNDIYTVDNDLDTVEELVSDGTDTVRVDLYDYTLGANVENLEYVGLDYIEVTGNGLANVITLGAIEDTAYGAGGNDTIYGLAGDDLLYGDGGNDVLNGGAGMDLLTGGTGSDFFAFDNNVMLDLANPDLVTDFVQGTDKIDLSAIDLDYISGNQAMTFLGTGAFTGSDLELRYVTSGGNTILQGDIDGDFEVDFEIVLSGTFTMSGSDFIL